MATDIEIAWLAGLLEGEGCFMIQHHASPSIQLAMTDFDVVAKAAKIMEMGTNRIFIKSKNKERANEKPCYVLRCDGPEAFVWMRAIRHHMCDRRGAKIDEVISTVKSKRPHIDKGRDHCRKGHSIKDPSEYYTKMDGGRQCKRCLGVKPKYIYRGPTVAVDVNSPDFINPFKRKNIINE